MKLYGALIGLSLIWGLSFVFIENLIGVAGVWGTVFLRCLAGALILLPLLRHRLKKRDRNDSMPWKSMIVVGVFNAGLPWGLIALSQTTITSNTAAVLNALTPLLTGLIGFVVFSVLLNKQQWSGVLLGFMGVLVLMEFQIVGLLSEDFIGIGTMVLATTCYGFTSHFVKRYLKGMDVIILTTISLLMGAFVGAVGIFFTQSNFFIKLMDSMDYLFLISVIGLGCVGSGIAHLLFYYIIDRGGAGFASTVTYLVPVTALFWGNLLLGEPVTVSLLAGLFIIFLGVFLSNKKLKISLHGFQGKKV